MPRPGKERIIVRCAPVWASEGVGFFPTNLVEIHRTGQGRYYFIQDEANHNLYHPLCACCSYARERLDASRAKPLLLESPEIITKSLNFIERYSSEDLSRVSEALVGIVKMIESAGLKGRE